MPPPANVNNKNLAKTLALERRSSSNNDNNSGPNNKHKQRRRLASLASMMRRNSNSNNNANPKTKEPGLTLKRGSHQRKATRNSSTRRLSTQPSTHYATLNQTAMVKSSNNRLSKNKKNQVVYSTFAGIVNQTKKNSLKKP